MATRRRTAKKKPAKRSNSNIQSAQRAASQQRVERAQKAAETGKPQAVADAKLKAAQDATDPGRLLSKSTLDQNVKPGSNKPGIVPPFKGGSEAANKVAGLLSGIGDRHQQATRKLADASLYGGGEKDRAAKLTALMDAQSQVRDNQLKKTGNAVYMGPKQANAKVRNRGPERYGEDGKTTSNIGPVGDNVVTKDELMSWLADEANFNKIRTAANKAGIDAQTYDDVAKVWTSVVNQAAATFSSTGKKVTPWALLQLRGKTMVGGKPASKTTVSTSIDEMDPAQAKQMIRNAASQALGRDPTKEEIEDFIAKAQTIAKQNPNVTTTTTNYGFDGEPVSQTSYSKGGGDAVSARAQEAATEQSKQSEDYSAYQAAGVYMPWLMDALASPV